MSNLAIFARLIKVDEATRQITGVIADETVDFAGEVFDYEKSKPHFVDWSNAVSKASGGKSVGNLRAQHGSVVAGKLSELHMDDVSRSISVVADVVDDNEWNKVLKGCYTGFSIGGSYVGKWDDETLGKKRYEAKPSEVSIVDLPCNPNSSFVVKKADGSEEMRKYLAADTVATDDAVVAGAPVQKMVPGVVLLGMYGDALAKSIAAGDADTFNLLRVAAIVVDGPEVGMEMEKSLYNASRVCDLLNSLGWITSDLGHEAKFEADNSAVPEQFKGVVRQLGQALIALVQEEVAELVSNYEGEPMATAAPVGDLKKEAGGDAAESASTPATPAAESDPANETLLKSIGALIDERMTKALADVSVNNEKIAKGIGELRERLDANDAALKKLADAPAPGGPRLRVVDKADELKKDLPGSDAGEVEPVKGSDGKPDDATTLIKAAHAGGGKPLQR